MHAGGGKRDRRNPPPTPGELKKTLVNKNANPKWSPALSFSQKSLDTPPPPDFSINLSSPSWIFNRVHL